MELSNDTSKVQRKFDALSVLLTLVLGPPMIVAATGIATVVKVVQFFEKD